MGYFKCRESYDRNNHQLNSQNEPSAERNFFNPNSSCRSYLSLTTGIEQTFVKNLLTIGATLHTCFLSRTVSFLTLQVNISISTALTALATSLFHTTKTISSIKSISYVSFPLVKPLAHVFTQQQMLLFDARYSEKDADVLNLNLQRLHMNQQLSLNLTGIKPLHNYQVASAMIPLLENQATPRHAPNQQQG